MEEEKESSREVLFDSWEVIDITIYAIYATVGGVLGLLFAGFIFAAVYKQDNFDSTKVMIFAIYLWDWLTDCAFAISLAFKSEWNFFVPSLFFLVIPLAASVVKFCLFSVFFNCDVLCLFHKRESF